MRSDQIKIEVRLDIDHDRSICIVRVYMPTPLENLQLTEPALRPRMAPFKQLYILARVLAVVMASCLGKWGPMLAI